MDVLVGGNGIKVGGLMLKDDPDRISRHTDSPNSFVTKQLFSIRDVRRTYQSWRPHRRL